MATRPTTDRLRETLFNVLSPRIEEAIFADLFSGSGAVGIEALSRGAAQVYFVEQAKPALQALRENLKTLAFTNTAQIESRSVKSFLAKVPRLLDIVFLDPPYEAEAEYKLALSVLGEDTERLLAQEAIVIAEHRKKQPLEAQYGKLKRYRVLEQGDAALSFYRRASVED